LCGAHSAGNEYPNSRGVFDILDFMENLFI
jgi:hypothetical protein